MRTAINAQSANTTAGNTGQTTSPPPGSTTPVGQREFTAGSFRHRENTGYDQSGSLGAGPVQPPVLYVPATGFLDYIALRVDLVTTGASPALSADGPWNLFTDFTLQEPNGQPIVQLPTGYNAYLMNKYGGYRGAINDPKQWGTYVTPAAGTAGTTSFLLYVPVTVAIRDALGALPNQASNAQFQFRMNLAPFATVFTGTITACTYRIRAWVGSWLQPAAQSLGQSQATEPPEMDTTQFWTQVVLPLVAGQNYIEHQRKGLYMRQFIYVYRDNSVVRQESQVFPIATVELDGNPLDIVDDFLWINQISERYGYGYNILGANTNDTAGGKDAGVRPYDFAHDFDGSVGFETRKLWMYTLTTTRLRLLGTAAAAGSITIITNDVSIPGNAVQGG
jgi:hypothetical protein